LTYFLIAAAWEIIALTPTYRNHFKAIAATAVGKKYVINSLVGSAGTFNRSATQPFFRLLKAFDWGGAASNPNAGDVPDCVTSTY
jgi:hypothetical protein